MSARGWGLRAIGVVATGTTSLTVTLPTGTLDDDIMVLCLAHKGSGYATVPGDWTLVGQNVSGSTRGEMYWKRASSEGPSFSITGLADTAEGVIVSYSGGLLVGDVVDLAVTRANASGTTGVGAFSPTVEADIVLAMQANGSTLSTTSPLALAPTDVTDQDTTFNSFNARVNQASAIGSGIYLAVADKLKIMPGSAGGLQWTPSTLAIENVGIVAAFIPEPASLTNNRFYLSLRSANAKFYGRVQGEWNQFNGPAAYQHRPQNAFLLSAQAAGAGSHVTSSLSNNEANIDVCYGRWVTRPLDAQTLTGGTLTLTLKVGIADAFGPAPCVYKLHAYVTQGQTTTVRTVLVDNEVDVVDWTATATFRSVSFSLPTSTAVLDGDSIMLEIGFSLGDVAPYTGSPTLPATAWTFVSLDRGATTSNQTAGPGLIDATDSETTATFAPWVEFSQALVESAVASPPANDACLDAIPINTLPYDVTDLDVTQAQGMNRAAWYSWTCPATGRYIITTRGSNYSARIRVLTTEFSRTCGTWQNGDFITSVTTLTGSFATQRESVNCVIFDAVMGVDYFLLFDQSVAATGFGIQSGGLLSFQFNAWQTLSIDDLYFTAGGQIIGLRDGVMTAYSPDLSSSATSGIAIDYTKAPMYEAFDNPGTIHDGYRLLVVLFGGKPLIEIVDLETLDVGRPEIDFIFASLGGSNRDGSTVEINKDGVLYLGCFGNGFQLVGDEGASYENTLSSALACAINGIEATHGDNQPQAPWPSAALYSPVLEKTGTDYVRLTIGNTLLYTSSGQYVPAGGTLIKGFDPATATQLANFTSAPGGGGPNPGPKGICALPDGGALLCNGSTIQRFDPGGNLIQTYSPTPTERANTLADVDLTNDGAHFWALNSDIGNLFKFELDSGVQLLDVDTHLGTGNSTSFVVFRPDRFVPPVPPHCPGLITGPRTDGLPYTPFHT